MFNIGAGEMILILVVALLFLGPQKLPELARGLGKFMREFRRQTDDVRNMVEREFYKMDQEINALPENTATHGANGLNGANGAELPPDPPQPPSLPEDGEHPEDHYPDFSHDPHHAQAEDPAHAAVPPPEQGAAPAASPEVVPPPEQPQADVAQATPESKADKV